MTLANVEDFIRRKEYDTAAALLTILLQRLRHGSDPEFLSSLVCRRADCLLQMVSVCQVSIIGRKKRTVIIFFSKMPFIRILRLEYN